MTPTPSPPTTRRSPWGHGSGHWPACSTSTRSRIRRGPGPAGDRHSGHAGRGQAAQGRGCRRRPTGSIRDGQLRRRSPGVGRRSPGRAWLALPGADTPGPPRGGRGEERLCGNGWRCGPRTPPCATPPPLYLSGQDKTAEAGVLWPPSRSGWTQDMDALDRRLARSEVLARPGRAMPGDVCLGRAAAPAAATR